jgi:hypothetical protein
MGQNLKHYLNARRCRSGQSPEITGIAQFGSIFLWLLSGFLRCSMVRSRMPEQTSRLKNGDRAPEFQLTAANRDGKFTLSAALKRGAVILEFLRGTW